MLPTPTPRPYRPILAMTALALLAATTRAPAQEASPAAARLKADVTFLADDAREGRAPGTKGIEAAADYIAAAFKDAGLKPAAGLEDYFQPFSIRGEPRLTSPPTLALAGPDGQRLEARPRLDFNPLAVGGAGEPERVPVVFAGYGITAKDRPDGPDYDDYEGLDVEGKAVLIFRHAPRQDAPDSPFHGPKAAGFATFRHKARNAYQHGAKAVLLVNDLAGLKDGRDELIPFEDAGPTGTRIPFLMLTRDFAERLLAASGLPGLEELEHAYQAEGSPRGRPLDGWTATARVEIDRPPIATRNVVGVLEGAGPHAEETVVVGAHYDHLGRGGPGSLAFGSHAIHNGADDNASGTALVIELARRLGRRADPPPRRVVFVAFSGEELGLLGSAHYVAHPPYPLRDTAMMLNFDMVGRLNDRDELSLYGTASVTGLDPLIDALGQDEGFVIRKASGGFGLGDRFTMASDHASFLMRGIPYLFFFTGIHRDYHKPTDDTEAVNFAGMARVADLGELVLLDILRRPRRPEFIKAPTPRGHAPDHAAQDPALGGSPTAASLGTIPDYSGGEDAASGVKLAGVREGGPAEKAGIQGGDVVVKFAGQPIETLEDYTEALRGHKPGETVEVVVKRDGKDVPIRVTLGSRGDAAK